MFRTRQQSQPVFRPASERHVELTADNYSGAVYVGLGDRFDDDRRLVRETVSKREARMRFIARLAQGAGLAGHS
jgi:hypothetical protein